MFNIKSQLLGAAAVLPVVAAGLLGSAGSAQAYTGAFNYGGTSATFGGSVTTATVSASAINFNPNPGPIALALQKGDFTGDNVGYIYSLTTSAGSLSPAPQKFINVGVNNSDTVKILSLSTLHNAVFTSQAAGTDLNLGYTGFFEDGSQATGYITFATQDSKAVAEAKYAAGGFDATFTGLTVTSVPEPTTILGLGFVAAGMTIARRRKSVTA